MSKRRPLTSVFRCDYRRGSWRRTGCDSRSGTNFVHPCAYCCILVQMKKEYLKFLPERRSKPLDPHTNERSYFTAYDAVREVFCLLMEDLDESGYAGGDQLSGGPGPGLPPDLQVKDRPCVLDSRPRHVVFYAAGLTQRRWVARPSSTPSRRWRRSTAASGTGRCGRGTATTSTTTSTTSGSPRRVRISRGSAAIGKANASALCSCADGSPVRGGQATRGGHPPSEPCPASRRSEHQRACRRIYYGPCTGAGPNQPLLAS